MRQSSLSFTDNAQNVMTLANKLARDIGDNSLRPEHVLYTLVDQGNNSGVNVLKDLLGVDMNETHLEVRKLFKRPARENSVANRQSLPKSDRLNKVIKSAEDEARNHKHSHVGTDHLLISLLGETEGVAAIIFKKMGCVPENIIKFIRAQYIYDTCATKD